MHFGIYTLWTQNCHHATRDHILTCTYGGHLWFSGNAIDLRCGKLSGSKLTLYLCFLLWDLFKLSSIICTRLLCTLKISWGSNISSFSFFKNTKYIFRNNYLSPRNWRGTIMQKGTDIISVKWNCTSVLPYALHRVPDVWSLDQWFSAHRYISLVVAI